MSLSLALRGLAAHGGGLLRGAAVSAGASLSSPGIAAQQQTRAASSHAENTNTFLREVCFERD